MPRPVVLMCSASLCIWRIRKLRSASEYTAASSCVSRHSFSTSLISSSSSGSVSARWSFTRDSNAFMRTFIFSTSVVSPVCAAVTIRSK